MAERDEMKVQLILDNMVVATTSGVTSRGLEKCPACGRMQEQRIDLQPEVSSLGNRLGWSPHTRVQVRMIPE